MKKLKTKKACKKNKGRLSKSKFSYNGKSVNCSHALRKDDIIDINVDESPYRVFVAVYVMKNDEPLKLVQFETEINSVRAAIDFAEPISRIDGLRADRVHDRLAEILTNASVVKDELDKIIINYIGCFKSELAFAEFPDQHIGYSMYFDVDDHDRCRVRGGAKTTIEQVFNRVIGNPVNEELVQSMGKNDNADEQL